MFDALAKKHSLDWLKRLQLIRWMKWERTEIKLAWLGAAFIALSWWLPHLEALQPVLKKLPWAPFILLSLGTTLIAYFLYRAWQFIESPLDIPEITGPIVRGASAFSPEDGEIFKKLGRQEELGKLRDWILDPQTPAILVMGKSGVGKTSLLRAGIQNLVGFDVAYWEATTFFSVERLQKSINKQLGEDSSNDSRKVLLIDQAEQLGPDRDVFELLGQYLLSEPPYSTTWILAMRREYLPDWFEWSEEQLTDNVVNRVKILPVKDFTPGKAKEVFAILADEAGLTVKEEVLREFIDNVIEEDRVSPVDLAIALQVLVRHPKQAVDSKYLLSIGGHSAMLTSYLEGELEIFNPDVRREIYRALLELVDLGADRRKAAGRSIRELIEIAQPVSPATFTQAIKRLALPGVRVLEQVGGRYRLVHERFIPAVRRLAGDVMTSAEQASRLLARRYQHWRAEEKARRYLLTGLEARQIEHELPRIVWGKDQEGKQNFLKLSVQLRRQRQRWNLGGLVLLLIAASFGFQWWQAEQNRRQMQVWRLPVGLYELLPQVKSLSLGELWVTELGWLKQAENLETLEINAILLPDLKQLPQELSQLSLYLTGSQITSLDGLPQELVYLHLNLTGSQTISLNGLPQGLKKLDLYLTSSHITSLDGLPKELEQLYLDLKFSQVTSLDALPQGLTQLHLHLAGTSITSLNGLPQGLTQLHLDLSGSRITRLDGLPQGLTQLHLDLSDSLITSLDGLPHGLKKLNLDLSDSLITELYGQPQRLKPDSRIKSLDRLPQELSQLDLNLANSAIASLDRLPQGLNQLDLNLAYSLVTSLDGLPQGLNQLDLNLANSLVTSLDGLPQRLEQLNLYLANSSITSLDGLPQGLKQLNFDLYGSPSVPGSSINHREDPSHLLQQLKLIPSSSRSNSLDRLPQELKQFKSRLVSYPITTLDNLPQELNQLGLRLFFSPVTTLDSLPQELDQLDLNLSASRITTLNGLPQGLGQLNLGLSLSRITTLDDLPQELEQLDLHLSISQVTDLDSLPQGLKQLNLDLAYSLIEDLDGIPQGLERLELDLTDSLITSLDGLPQGLEQLQLHLPHSLITSLDGLPQGLEQLELHLTDSLVTTMHGLPLTISRIDLDLSDSQVTSLEAIPKNSDLELHLKF